MNQKDMQIKLYWIVDFGIRLIVRDMPDDSSMCPQGTLNLGEFKKRASLTPEEIKNIQKGQEVTNELFKLEICERLIKAAKDNAKSA